MMKDFLGRIFQSLTTLSLCTAVHADHLIIYIEFIQIHYFVSAICE